MKILIVSDTHGVQKNLDIVLRKVSPIDMLIHLGDVEGFEDTIQKMAGCPVKAIAGNNDYYSRLDRERMVDIGKYKVFLTHGDKYQVYAGVERLREEGLRRGADIVMFGHTHMPMIEKGEITILNPGSISFPRQEGRVPSYILMDLDREGNAHFAIHYLMREEIKADEERLHEEWRKEAERRVYGEKKEVKFDESKFFGKMASKIHKFLNE